MRWPEDDEDRMLPGHDPARSQQPPPGPPGPEFGGVIPDDFGGGGGGGGGGDEEIPDFGSWSLPAYGGPWQPEMNFGAMPQFHAPQFHAPSFEEAQNEPGYQFRLGSGRDALERSAAARGTLRTGGTLTNILEYGQNFGAQEYTNMFNRALATFGANYKGAWDEYSPQMQEWLFRSGASRDAGLAGFNLQGELYRIQAEAAQRAEDRAMQIWLSGQPQAPPQMSAY